MLSSYLIFNIPSLNFILTLLSVSLLTNAATAVAQAAVPHAFVKPAPRSQTLTVILFLSSTWANVTLIFSLESFLYSLIGLAPPVKTKLNLLEFLVFPKNEKQGIHEGAATQKIS